MIKNLVDDKHIQNVIDGFNEYAKISAQSKSFNVIEFKNFMEPIFSKEGYRTDAIYNGGGYNTNILIIHDAGVGDFILMSGAIREIRRVYPTSHITLVIFPTSLNVAEMCPYVDEIIINARGCNWGNRNLADIYMWNIGIAKQLLEIRYDMVFAFAFYEATPMLAYMSGAKERFSFKYDTDSYINGVIPCYAMSPLMTVEVSQQIYGKHIADRSFGFLDYILRSPVVNREIEVWYSAFDFTIANNILKMYKNKKIYAICMGGTNFSKLWPAENYAALAEMILKNEKDSVFVILGGGKMDNSFAKIFKHQLKSEFENQILDLVDKITYRQSAAILSLCDCYIGNDTGTMHLATALKVPVLVACCFPADVIPTNESSVVRYYPYRVPSVVVQPKQALPECKSPINSDGCTQKTPHCIRTISVTTMFSGLKLLKEQIDKRATSPLFIN